MSDHPLNEVEFQRELINRFFHQSSYFFRCINHELEPLLKEVSNGEEEKYLLLGNLVDKLVAAEDTLTELERLSKIGHFSEFNDKMLDGVQHLYKTNLDTERMKIEIEGLAHSLFNTALHAFEEEDSVVELRNFLSVNGKKNNGAASQQHEIPETKDLPSDSFESTQAEFDLAGEENLSDETCLAGQDVQSTETDMEVRATVDDDSVGNEEGSSGASECETVETPSIEMSGEPASVIAAFREKVKHLMVSVADYVNGASRAKTTCGDLEKCAEVLESVATTATIFGFEPFEQITLKARRAILNMLAMENLEAGSAVITVTHAIIAELLEDPEHIDTATVKQSTARILQIVEKPTEEPQADNDPEDPTGSNDGSSKSGDEEGEALSATTFNLPGEEDEEIRTLIDEINRDQLGDDDSGQAEDEIADIDDRRASDEEDSGKSDDQETASATGRTIRAVHQGNLSIYRQQSELYFSVIEDALQTLEKQSDNMTALEDLELASNALYGLTLKLDLDPLGAFPDVVLNLIKNMLATNYSFSAVEHKLIRNAFRYFKSLDRPEDTVADEFHAVLASINDLNLRVRRGVAQHHQKLKYPNSAVGYA